MIEARPLLDVGFALEFAFGLALGFGEARPSVCAHHTCGTGGVLWGFPFSEARPRLCACAVVGSGTVSQCRDPHVVHVQDCECLCDSATIHRQVLSVT